MPLPAYDVKMGSGIFLWVERRLSSAKWEMVKRRQIEDREYDADEMPGPRYRWELGKNYNLFAIIADHRNYRGNYEFTTDVISPPRGLPADISDEVLRDATTGFFGSSGQPTRAQRMNALLANDIVAASWVTLEELLAVDWEQATHGEGVLGEEGDFLVMLREEIVPVGPPDVVRLVFFFDC